MRIISNFQDYYDGYQNYNSKDRFNRIWVRNPDIVEVNKRKLRIFEERCMKTRMIRWDAGYIILAGNVVPYLVNSSMYEDKVKWYFEPKQAFENYQKSYNKEKYKWWQPLKYKHFVEFFNFTEEATELCIQVDSPLLLIEPNGRYYKERYSSIRKIKRNINLKKFGATNILHGATIYQLLDQFISNQMVSDEMPETEMTEKQKMQQHGFTHKYSFRKEPSNK